jgi:transcriptional regulator with XRE-family HTH domain
MKTDAEVLLMKRERAKGRTQEQAAARAGMGVRTVRRYERGGKLPSQMRPPRSYRTRPNPFADDWSGIASREFPARAVYQRFLQDLVRQRNLTRQARWAAEQVVLRPLPAAPLGLCRELRVRVSRFSTIQVLRNTYSVPARLIGAVVTVRVRAETLEVYHGTVHLLTIPRLLGHHQHHVEYHHIIWSLVRKPGAFAQYRYRDDLFPTLAFRQAYDRLVQATPSRADREYVRLLHLAAGTSESEVETALLLLAEQRLVPTFDAVRGLVQPAGPGTIPQLTAPVIDLSVYDQLLTVGASHA